MAGGAGGAGGTDARAACKYSTLGAIMRGSSGFWKTVLLVLALLLGVAAQAFAAAPGCTDTRHLVRALRTVGSTSVAAGLAQTAEVSLPDTLPRTQLGGTMQLHYRLILEPCAQERAVLIARAGAGYTLTIDGQAVQRLGPLPDPQAAADRSDAIHNPRIPALFRIPPKAQVLEIRLHGLPFVSFGLPIMRVGAAHTLAPVHAHLYRRIIEWTQTGGDLITVFAAMGLWVWWRRPHDLGLKWFLISSGVWIFRGHYGTVTELPLSPNAYEIGIALQVVLMAPTTVVATLHILRRWSPRWGRWVWGSTAFCTLLLLGALALPVLAHALRSVAYLITLGWLSTACVLALRYRKSLAGWRGTVVVLGYGAMIGGVALDYLRVQGVLAFSDENMSMLVWGYLALLLCLLVVLTDHALHAVDRIRKLNVELDRRVGERTREIAHLYAQRETEQLAYADTQARQQERERLVREIHDGIGGQLTTALRAVERGCYTPQRLGQSLQECLDDLRLVMDASSSHERLDAALAAWRHRWDTRLELLGVALRWQVQDPLDDGLGAQAVLHLLRVLQEAVTNVLKHARATVVDVQVDVQDAHLVLRVHDNGQGGVPAAPRAQEQGRGLASMQQRALALGGSLSLHSAPGHGTTVTVRAPLPVSAPVRAAPPPT